MAKVNPVNTEENNKQDQLQLLMEQVAILTKKIEESEKPKVSDGKSKYEGPRYYSYTIIADTPVLDYISVKKEKHLDWQYRNIAGHMINNQSMLITLASKNDKGENETITMDAIEFNKNLRKSEKMPCEKIHTDNSGKPVGYEFKDEKFGSFIVLHKVIN